MTIGRVQRAAVALLTLGEGIEIVLGRLSLTHARATGSSTRPPPGGVGVGARFRRRFAAVPSV
jgi:hypothetical protein